MKVSDIRINSRVLTLKFLMRRSERAVSRKLLTFLAGVVVLITSSLAAIPAGASPDLSQSATISALANAGAFADALPSATHDQGTTSATLSSGETVSLPGTGAGGITVADSTISLGLGLPTGTTGSGVEIASSSTLYSTPLHYSVAATITSSGVRESVAMENASAPTSYSYPITLPSGEFLSPNPDGSVSVMKSFSEGSISLGTFQSPWARDANGNPVSTNYTVQGSTLIQHVDVTPATAFPVVADPTLVSVGTNGVTIRLTLSEQVFIVNGGGAALVAVMCADPAALAVCATVAGVVAGSVAVLDMHGFCTSTDYFWATQGWMPWDGLTWGCKA